MANGDLQNLTGPVIFETTAAVNAKTFSYLVPTDGPKITAASNAAGQAPVKPGFLTTIGWLLGLRGATLGDFTGAVKKTFQGLAVSIVGGATSTTAPGVLDVEGPAGGVGNAIVAFSGNIHAELGDVVAQTGDVVSVGSRCIAGDTGGTFGFLSKGILGWLGTLTGASGANPPQGTQIKNQLRAINIPKAAAHVVFSAPNVIASHDGYGISVVALNADPTILDVTFADFFANTNYTFSTAPVMLGVDVAMAAEITASRTTGGTQVRMRNISSNASINMATTLVAGFSIAFSGQQNT